MKKALEIKKRTIKMEAGMWERFDAIKKVVSTRYSKNADAQTIRRLIYLYDEAQYRRYE